MKKRIIKAAVFVLTFLISLLVISKIMNQGNNNMTMEMAKATLPVITMQRGELSYNELHGYKQAMNTAFMQDTVTELSEDRSLEFTVDTYGVTVNGISIEVRNMEGSRLIENTPVTELSTGKDSITAKITLKDLIEQDKEYALVILLDTGEENPIRYYTKVIWSENTALTEKLSFVEEFHQVLFDKERAKEEGIAKYLESNASGDNSSFHKVDIHSSFQMITWGDLSPRQVTESQIQVTQLQNQTACFLVNFLVSTRDDKKETYYTVQEYYRVRYLPNAERMYLLNYERTMTQIPDETGELYGNDKLILGIADENTVFQESEDGNIVVFESANRLFSYNATTNKLAVLFSFYNKENQDARDLYGQHGIKILDVDEGGNVNFAVYGYMNRGRHEGEVGIAVYYYDSALNTIEEAVYIPCDTSFSVLQAEMEQLLYVNRDNKLYVFLDNVVYEADLEAFTWVRIAQITQDGTMQVSDNHKLLVWQEGEDLYHGDRLLVRNLGTGDGSQITAGAGEAIMPMGFIGEDIVYGLARISDIIVDAGGRSFFPMYKICINDASGNLLRSDEKEDVYITGWTVTDERVVLDRVQLVNGAYKEIEQDYLMLNNKTVEGKNKYQTVTVEKYLKYVQIQTRKEIDAKTIQVLNPKEVVFEGGRTLKLSKEEEKSDRYYVYGAYGVNGIYVSEAKAVEQAYEESGRVTDEEGRCIFIRGNRVTRNQIMAIKETSMSEERSSLAVCLDTMLSHAGVVRNTQTYLDMGQSAEQILQDNLDAEVLNLTGCNLDAMLYYVNQDIPVLAILKDGEAVLVTGFNEFNVVILEPSTGKLYQKGMNDSTEWFAENGNYFLTYVRQED